jgi:hypothetical protein
VFVHLRIEALREGLVILAVIFLFVVRMKVGEMLYYFEDDYLGGITSLGHLLYSIVAILSLLASIFIFIIFRKAQNYAEKHGYEEYVINDRCVLFKLFYQIKDLY